MKLILISLCVLMMAGCAANEPAASTQPTAKCLVCEKNADLACVNIEVDASTPKYDYNGKAYYFCSDECRAKFAKNPAKYVK